MNARAVLPGTPAPLMACGCVATAVDETGRWICPAHWGVHPGWATPVDAPDLTGRWAKCALCSNRAPSSLSLPFFEYGGNDGDDLYYCGCKGWD